MKRKIIILIIVAAITASCTSSKKLAYLSNIPETSEFQYFPMDIPDYKVQSRDILYITIKAMTSEGNIRDLLQGNEAYSQGAYIRDESSQFIMGYDIDLEGKIRLPVIGEINVGEKTLNDIRGMIQEEADKYFKNTFVECKLLGFKFTVLGEARMPGTYVNYNNYLTILEAIGRAGGVGDFGRRDEVLIIRSKKDGTQTYRINLQDKEILSSEAYFIMPNDVVIIQPVNHKIFNMNLPTFSFILASVTSTISTTLLLISFFGSK